ncbi:glycosyltransferase family 2 protein [Flavobacterium limnophilum]|uniref:glycosyltransferase family 2 protein n=1 Tax=Flavobacterium limnophilum TaxID=3003262 RepID=UPI002482966E|nr:glycosyltransferase family 2 protein [Flavobacterium limnophilum]
MLAIVIPYFKFTFFEATLESLANQTDKRFKVYIGDDASPEDPSDLLVKYRGKFDFVYHRFETNLGGTSLTQQWERCIALSGVEEWIMILGDDDVLDETVIASWHKNYNTFNGKSNVVRFSTKMINDKLGTVTEIFKHPEWEQAIAFYYRRFKEQTRSSLSEYVFSKSSYSLFGFHKYPLGWHSDDRAWLEFPNNKPIYSINESIVFVRYSSISITGKSNNKELKNKASSLFFKYIIVQKLRLFKKNQRNELLLAYETAIKKSRKLTSKEWFFLMYLYLTNFEVIPFAKFLRRFLISILKS